MHPDRGRSPIYHNRNRPCIPPRKRDISARVPVSHRIRHPEPSAGMASQLPTLLANGVCRRRTLPLRLRPASPARRRPVDIRKLQRTPNDDQDIFRRRIHQQHRRAVVSGVAHDHASQLHLRQQPSHARPETPRGRGQDLLQREPRRETTRRLPGQREHSLPAAAMDRQHCRPRRQPCRAQPEPVRRQHQHHVSCFLPR